jgi:hypothetical protein
MAEGLRITESGLDTRISESGDTRVTEGFFEGFASLASAATIAAVATATILVGSDLQATGSKMFAGVGEFQGLTTLSAEGTIESQGNRERFVDSSLSSSGSITAEYVRERPGSSSLSSSGSILAESFFRIDAETSLVASSSFVVDADARLEGLFEGFFEEGIRETQGEDTRITESGDVRITNEVIFNVGVGGLTVETSKVDFNATAFYKRGGVWEPIVPYVKDDGVWKEPIAVYKNISGSWKRIY